MKVLVTGASGFLGRHVLDALDAAGIASVALGRHRPAGRPDLDWMQADLFDGPDLQAEWYRANASHLLHLAWITEPGTYRDSSENLRWVDVSVRLVQAFCAAGGQHVVVAGSCAEYSWMPPGWCNESATPLQADSVYGAAKDATRRLLLAVCASYRVSLGWARIFFPYGAGQRADRLMPSLAEALLGSRPPFAVRAAQQRDFIAAPDVAQALMHLLKLGAQGEYNVCTGQPVRMDAVVRQLAELLQVDPSAMLLQADRRDMPPLCVAGDNRRLLSLGLQPPATLQQGLARQLSDAGLLKSRRARVESSL